MARRQKPEVQMFIVKSLACFWTPTQIIKAVQEEFDETLSISQVVFYDVTKGGEIREDGKSARGLSKKWVDIFLATRESFIKDEASHPVSYEGYRLGILQQMINQALKQGNKPLVAELLAQAARERGGMFTNRRQLKIDDPLGELAKILGTSRDDVESSISGKGINDDVPQIG